MLNKKQMQQELKDLGFYKGSVDGVVGPKTTKAIKDLQKKYFIRKSDIDGVYGKNTDILLQSAYNFRDVKYFNLMEFKCKCNGKYCSGYPTIISYDLVHYADSLRTRLGVPMTITSGLRCSKWNSVNGGASLSRHKSGKAFDFSSSYTNGSLNNRKDTINYWVRSYPNARYGYCNGYGNCNGSVSSPNVPTMGTSVHLDVK